MREEIVAIGLLIVALDITGILAFPLAYFFPHHNYDLDLIGFLLILGIVLTISGFILPHGSPRKKLGAS